MPVWPQVVPEEGGEFQMFGGSVVGKFLQLKPNAEILLEWRFCNWKESDVSKVRVVPPNIFSA
jgi:activator of HSP90 ATPase